MATRFADTVLDLEQLRESIIKHLALVPSVERFLAPLDAVLALIRTLSSTRKTLIADKQKVTQELKAAVAAAQDLAIDARAVIRGEVGSRSEKLVEFGVSPLRRRSRKARPAEEPEAATQATK
jgi:hypothetical protein